MLTSSCGYRRRGQPMDCCKDAVEQITADGHFGQLKRDGAGMTDDPCTDLDQPGLQAGQRPICHLLGQVCALQENTEVVGQCMKLKSHLVLDHALAGQARPIDRLLAFLDALLNGATLIVETDDPVWVHRKVGHDKAGGHGWADDPPDA